MDKANANPKDKGTHKWDLVLRYDSKLQKKFQKNFQIKWEGTFKALDQFPNDTYQLADLDATIHGDRVFGSKLKKYATWLMAMVTNAHVEDVDDAVPSLHQKEDYGGNL